MKIGIGSDENGFELKEELKVFLKDTQYDVIDYGCNSGEEVDYPNISFEVAKDISEKKLDRGILICGTGIGMAIAACKYPGIRAALCHDTYSAERAQLSNNAQVMTIGAQIIGPEVAKKVLEAYLNAEWAKGSERKVNLINEKENEFLKK